MVGHYIILSSAYSIGKRIGLHYADEKTDELKKKVIEHLFYLKRELGDLSSVSTHYLETEELAWESVLKKDAFFDEVKVLENVSDFSKLVKEDKKLKALDVAKYIQSSVTKCTHLKLEKLVYLCYADYLCKYGKQLFEDRICAYKYGPVVESVYDVYRGKKTLIRRKDLPAMRSRIMFAQDGAEKMRSIEETIKKYGHLSARELVDITHRTNSPWSKKKDTYYGVITDKLILKYHSVEGM